MSFGVNSNGLLFNKQRSQQLAALNPAQVTIGFDGVGDESYFQTRGLKKGFTKVSGNMDNLLEAGIKNVSIGSVLMWENLNDWVKLAEFALEKGLAGIRYTAYHDAYFNPQSDPRGSKYQDPTFRSRVAGEIEKLIELKRKTGIVKNSEAYLKQVCKFYKDQRNYFPNPCLQGSNRIEIDVYGNVNLCSFVTESLGNLLQKEMEDIWNSEKHRRARLDAYKGNCPHCFLSCYAEENLRLSPKSFLPIFTHSFKRGIKLLGQGS
jgi:MoaA/NifB/PqqE/SkfB family radical SAM enzyme